MIISTSHTGDLCLTVGESVGYSGAAPDATMEVEKGAAEEGVSLDPPGDVKVGAGGKGAADEGLSLDPPPEDVKVGVGGKGRKASKGERRELDDMRMDPDNVPDTRIALGRRVPVPGLESLLFVNMLYQWAVPLYTDVSMVPFGGDDILRRVVVTARMKIDAAPHKFEISFQRNFHVYAYQCMQFG